MSWTTSRDKTMPAGTRTVTFTPDPDCVPSVGEDQGPVEDFTGTASRLEETDLYRNAVSVSDARVSEDPCDQAPILPSFQQKTLRRVEVPFTRKVKVAATTTKLVPKQVEQQVVVKKLREVECMIEVEEEYTEFIEVERTRDKEIWVKKIIQEKYFEKVPKKCTRKVLRPSKKMQEVEEIQTVTVETNEVQTVDTFRVDEVQDTKIVEVEEFEEIEYRPHKTGRVELHRTREMGRVPGNHLNRNTGHVLDEPTPDLDAIDNDSNAPGSWPAPSMTGACGDCYTAPSRPTPRDPNQSYYRTAQVGSAATKNDNMTNQEFLRAAGDFQHKNKGGPGPTNNKSIGLTVKNTHTKHTDGTGVLVTKVLQSTPASRAGLKPGDLVTKVGGYPTSTVSNFRDAALSTDGPLVIVFNRDGRTNIQVTLHR